MRLRTRLRLTVIGLALGIIAYWYWDYRREHRFDAVIRAAAHRYQVDPALVKAVVWRESKFDPDVHGRAGELGLMQIREAAASEWARAEHIPAFQHSACLDPVTNTLAGTWYLKKLMLRYPTADNPAAFALADYNAGRSNVLRWLNPGPGATNSDAFVERITYPSTRAYIRAILRRAEEYRPM